GVFDFVHRDPTSRAPFSSMSELEPPTYYLRAGGYRLPLDSGETRLLREGEPFWSVLARHGVPSVISRMPTDFPPHESAHHALSGMGTPDMMGGFGTFQFFTSDPEKATRPDPSGGMIHALTLEPGATRIETALEGPTNTLKLEPEPSTVAMVVELDAPRRVARVQLGAETVVIKVGEWSDWIPLEFELVPGFKSAAGMARLYLKSIEPSFELYVSPINVDPAAPELPITAPESYATELYEALGRFYTQGMAEETKGLSAHLLSRGEFVRQAKHVMNESVEMYEHEYARFDEGLLFFYFSSVDQAGHMLYGDHSDKLLWFYQRVDEVVGWTLDQMEDDTTLIVMSDHGFARFDYEVNLNTWLVREGFMAVDDPWRASEEPGFVGVDWSRTRAYAIGLNAIYLNLEGRERGGVVSAEEQGAVLDELERELLKFQDHLRGKPIVRRVYRPAKEFPGENLRYAPDLIVGFNPGYRMGSDAGLGALQREVLRPNRDEWIADHCMAHDRVPGVLLSNRPLARENPQLADIPVTVLARFGVPAPEQMIGKDALTRAR
ncbi:MAG: alkaline phosphatase family protein, partial [Myxococcales bacterium]|nr:alkaline phosphatase family protein [Myxococcales bacterium]